MEDMSAAPSAPVRQMLILRPRRIDVVINCLYFAGEHAFGGPFQPPRDG